MIYAKLMLYWCAAIIAIGMVDGLRATESGNRFDQIAVRNPFGLVSMQVRPYLPSAPAPKALPDVLLTGITDVCGRNQALVELTYPGSLPLRLILEEGQYFGGLEVVSIHLKKDLVKVRVFDEEMELNLAKGSVATRSRLGNPR